MEQSKIRIITDIPKDHHRIPYLCRVADELNSLNAVKEAAEFVSDGRFAGIEGLNAVRREGGIACLNVSQLEKIDPTLAALTLPFFLHDNIHEDGSLDRLISLVDSKLIRHGVRLVALMRGADQLFTHAIDGVTRLADLQGRRVRVAGPGIYEKTMRALDLEPVVHLIPGLPDAVRDGRLEVVFTSPGNWASLARDLMPNGLQVPGLMMITYAVVCPADWFDALSPAVQTAILETFQLGVSAKWPDMAKDDAKLLQRMISGGANVCIDPDIKGAEAKTTGIVQAYAAEHPEEFEQFRAVVK